mgnify:CR=1 FL=1
MNASSFRFILDMHSIQSQISIPVLLGDTSKRLYIGLSDGQAPYVIENGCIATFAAKKPDGTNIFNSCMIENNKTIVYEFTPNTTNVAGIVNCEIRLYGAGGEELTSPRFILVVDERVLSDEDIELSDNEYTALTNIFVAEQQRVVAEEARVEMENNRTEGEIRRNLNEEARRTAESNRGNAEDERKAAEEARKTAEDARVLAENERKAALEKAVEDAVASASEGATKAIEDGLVEAHKEYIGFYGEVVLSASAWALNTQAVTISDVEDNDFIMLFPATSTDNDLVSTNKVYCSSNAEGGYIQFSTATVPTEDIHLMYYVTRRGEG